MPRVADDSSRSALHDLRLADLATFLVLARTHSVSAAARELKVTPSQVSKALARVEQHYRVKLLTRGTKGMALSNEGRHILPGIAEAMKALSATGQVAPGPNTDTAIELTVAGPSYLLGIVVAAIAASDTALRLRGIEMAPAQLRGAITEGVFDLGLALGEIRALPPTWIRDEIGSFRKILVGPPGLVGSLPKRPLRVDEVRKLPFVGALSSMGGRFAPRADDCPLPPGERNIVHRVQTFGAALELAIRTHCVVFGPWIAARRLLQTGELVEISVEQWSETEQLAIVCNGDVIRDRLRRQLITTLHRELVEPERRPSRAKP